MKIHAPAICCTVITVIFSLVLLNGCQKNARLTPDNNLDLAEKASDLSISALVVNPGCTGLNDVMPAVNYDNDAIERPTVLGVKHVNPYLIPNMQKAYTNLGITSQAVNVTNLYVRFLPNSVNQLGTLDSIMDSQGLDLFDTPMDYDVTEGDYYQDPSIPIEQVTWQYAVVPPNFAAPSGITYQVLAQIHIPGDNYTAVETEAERLAAAQDCANAASATTNAVPVQTCPRCQVWSTTQNKCVPYTCPTGYVCDDGGTGGCILQPPPVDPPAPSTDAAIPAGNITVSDINLGTTPGVRTARVVVKRWFKIQRFYTDNNGHFTATKRFKHKVKVIVKFKNQYSTLRSIRDARVWQMVLPVERVIGVFSGDKSNINANFQYFSDVTSKGMRNWAAATTLNAVQEHRDYATALNFSAAPLGLNIYITNFNAAGSTPLFYKRQIQTVPVPFINKMMLNSNAIVQGGTAALATTLSRANADMTIGYKDGNIKSDNLKETVYHEMSHASHFTKAGMTWYTSFANAEINEIMLTAAGGGNSPYGSGTDANAPVIALGEGWAYFMGHFLADRRYAGSSSDLVEQGISYKNNLPVAGLSSHINLLEDFSPNRAADVFRWIPQGLFYDLMDNRNDRAFSPAAVVDEVSAYTVKQIHDAMQSDVTTLQQHRTRLQQQNPGNQTAQITNLYSQYGY